MNSFRCIYFLLYFSLIGTSVSSGCLLFNENERLSNFCLLESVEGKVVDKNTAMIITQKLKREGYFGGLIKSGWSTSFYPDIDYSGNINGGNPDKPLILGELEFSGDPDFIKQEGIITTLNLRSNNRSTFDLGRYLQTNLFGSYSYSPEHNNGFSNASMESCFSNKIAPKNSVDICASVSQQNKQISESNSKSLSFNLSNLAFNEYIGFSEGKLGLIHFASDVYVQNQLALSWDTIHKENFYSAVRLKVGNPVKQQIALKYGLTLGFSRIISNRKVSLSLTHEVSDGGILLGVDRSDITNKVGFNTLVSPSASVQLGYTSVDSSIDYFDDSYPSLSLTITW